MKFWNVTPPLRTHVPGPAPAGGGALNVSGSQASIKFTMTFPDAFIRWLTPVPSASMGSAVIPEGVISGDDVLDRLPGPQPNRRSTNAARTKRKGMSSAPFGAASRKRVAALGKTSLWISEPWIRRLWRAEIFDSRIQSRLANSTQQRVLADEARLLRALVR
jgi:hypothetical protein